MAEVAAMPHKERCGECGAGHMRRTVTWHVVHAAYCKNVQLYRLISTMVNYPNVFFFFVRRRLVITRGVQYHRILVRFQNLPTQSNTQTFVKTSIE